MNRFTKVMVLVLVGLFAAACSTTGKKGGAGAGVEDQSGAAGQGAGAGGAFAGRPWEDPSNPLSNRVIYFAYDSSEISAADREVIANHARYLTGNPKLTVTLEGNTDERGTREYNIALGERRANAVRDLMTVQGVSANQIKTVSYGEEKPAVQGHDEAAWAKNRRVEIVYSAQ